MKVCLFAPYLQKEFGGVWQFSQWVASRIGPHVPMHYALPDTLLKEMAANGAAPPATKSTSMRQIETALRRDLAYRLLDFPVRSGILGARATFYRKGVEHIQRQLVGGTMETKALLREMKANNVDVLHIPQQDLSDAIVGRQYPYVINPHDYQHEHFPQYFSPKALRHRRKNWYASQRAAGAIVVHSLQTRDDAIKYLDVPKERIFYAPYGPLATFPDVDEAGARRATETLRLPEKFIFYPSRMWAHKNHVTLLEALRQLKDKRGLDVPCVFTDAGGLFGDTVTATVDRLGLSAQVITVGRVSPEMMGALYRLSTMVVVPSLFEQNSGPMLEAIHFGKAVAVSNLPELVRSLGAGGLVFDPRSVDAIADAIDDVFSSPERQAELEKRARVRSKELSWAPFVEIYKSAYAFAAAR